MKNKLREYVARPDDSFSWRLGRRATFGQGLDGREVIFTSQIWQGVTWTHRMAVLVPEKIRSRGAVLLYITGGHHLYLSSAARVARQTGSIVAVLYDVPCQPLFDGRCEDALLSFTLMKFLETGDSDWPLVLPMTKAAVRGMDVLQEVCRQEAGFAADGFAVAGASKRGWTTWLAAAVDARVKGIAPAVYDNLDLAAQMRHQIAAWGEFSERIHDYTARGLPQLAAAGGAEELLPLIDPAVHLDAITIPKLLIIGTNDRYWPLDALNIYCHRLLGETSLIYLPNVGHNALNRERAVSGMPARSCAWNANPPPRK